LYVAVLPGYSKERTNLKMKRLRILTPRTLLALAAACGAAYVILFVVAASTRAQKAACGPAQAQTVVADSAARIYRVPAGHTALGTLYDYYGCTGGTAKPQLLSSGSALSRARAVKLRGAIAGLIVDQHGVDTGSSTLIVRDLTTGRVLHTVTVSYMVPRLFDSLVTYVLAPSGNIAWATESSPNFGTKSRVTIHRAIGRTVATLDQGRSIHAASLRVRGHMVQWIDGHQLRHASLP
jgi:hypothetical protein